MKIILVQSEMETALVEYLITRGIDTNGKEIGISLAAGRGKDGYTAEMDLTDNVELLDLINNSQEEFIEQFSAPSFNEAQLDELGIDPTTTGTVDKLTEEPFPSASLT